MKLYENKREITLYDALYRMKADQVPNHNFEFMISFDGVERLYVFGKTWTKKDTSCWGKNVSKYWIHPQYCPVLAFGNEDVFLANLFTDSMMHKYFNTKRFHVWEEVK